MGHYSIKTMSQNLKDIVRECALHFLSNENTFEVDVLRLAKPKSNVEKHILVFNVNKMNYVNNDAVATMNSELLSNFAETRKQYQAILDIRNRINFYTFDDELFYDNDWLEILGLHNFDKRQLGVIYSLFKDNVLSYEQVTSLMREDLSYGKMIHYSQAYREGFDVSELINPELSEGKLRIMLKAFRQGVLEDELKPLLLANASIIQLNQAINSINEEVSVKEIQSFVDSGFDQQYLIPKTTRKLIESRIELFCKEKGLDDAQGFDITELWIELKYCRDENIPLSKDIDNMIEEQYLDFEKIDEFEI